MGVKMILKLILGLLFSYVGLLNVGTLQAAETKELNQLFQMMEEAMYMTDVYFGRDHLERTDVPCSPKIVSEADFRREFVNIIQATVGDEFYTVAPDELSLSKLFATEIDQFVSLFDDGTGFLFCNGSKTGYMTYGDVFYFGSNSKTMTFEFGYED